MSNIFLTVLKMSITSSYVIVFVLIARLLLKRCPKIFSYMLWGVVLFRLLCPISFESKLSFIPNNSISDGSININKPLINYIDYSSENLSKYTYEEENSTDNIKTNQINTSNNAKNPIHIISVASKVWIMAISIIIFYSSYSFIKLKKHLKCSRLIRENIYENSDIDTAFVLGIINPKIYIPKGLSTSEEQYILAHERIHIKRNDYLIKIIAYIALIIHCFNPLVWLSFILMSKDMEMACDEAVIKEIGSEIKKEYSMSLLAFATEKKAFGITPIAFGEGEVKSRIKNVLNYKKPRFWITIISIVVVIIVGVGLMFNPIKADESLLDINKILEEISISSKVIISGNEKGAYILPGDVFSKNIKKGIENWSEDNIKLPDDVTEDITVYSDGQNEYKLGFYKEMPQTVKVSCDNNIKYYKTEVNAYDAALFVKSLSSYYLEEEVVKIITNGRKTNKTSYNDSPYYTDYLELNILNTRYYIYKDKNKYYLEIPYVAIYEIKKEDYESAKKYFKEPQENKSDTIDEDLIEELVCKTIEEDGGGYIKEDILIVTPKIFGYYSEENKLKVFATVFISNYSLNDNILEFESGGMSSYAITYGNDENGAYVLEELKRALDGGLLVSSIREFCTMPVSGKEIEGLADKILDYNMDYSDIIQLEREKLIQYLKDNNLKGISLLERKDDEPDKLIPLTN